MRISVVLPTHNRPALLLEAAASVLAQSWPDWELIVVDDGSVPAATLAMAPAFGDRLHWLRNEPAQGLSGARNRGIEAATGDVITFLDDDDLLAVGTLQAIARSFVEHPTAECLFVNVDPFGDGADGMRANQARTLGALLRRMGVEPAATGSAALGSGLFEALLDGLPLAFQRVAIRREALARAGLYALGPFGDLEWNFRIALRLRAVLVLDPLFRMRCEGQNFFTRGDAKSRLNDALLRIFQQLANLPEVRIDKRLSTKVSGCIARSRFDRAYLALHAGQAIPWRDFLLSMRRGPAWRHVSLTLRWCLARVGIER